MNSNSPLKSIHISNLLTYLSVLAAFYMTMLIVQPGGNKISILGLGITICFVCDLFDGKFAKLFKSRPEAAQKTGGQLDSLSDAIAFGFAPAACLLAMTKDISIIGSAFIFVIANLTRLAFFNVYSTESQTFIGLPTTLAGLLLSISILFINYDQSKVLAFILVVLAILMVIPLKIPRPKLIGYIVLVLLAAANFTVHFMRLK
jgi:CDP-diacylglycerol--serine O-phosphatidyltransferase